MPKRVLLITGTPGVGKTTVAKALAAEMNAHYINLTELAVNEHLIAGKDEERDSIIIDETSMKERLRQIIEQSTSENVVVDGHYAAFVVPAELVTYAFVLRRDPIELRQLMEKAGVAGRKLWENMASEILDVCLVDALEVLESGKVCELDVSSKKAAETVAEIQATLKGEVKCRVGIVDWLGKLENEGLLDECLRI